MKKLLSVIFLVQMLFTNMAFANEAEIKKSVQYSQDAYIVECAAVFEFCDGAQYQINTKPGYVTDIVLGEGEEITYIGGGETVRWVFDVAKVGSTNHVYVRPIRGGIDTNLIINTDKRTYRILLVATNWYNPAVSWTFPLDEQKKLQFENNLYIERGNRSYIASPDTLDFKYKSKVAKGGDKSFLPEQVFDNGSKTFIKLPKKVASNNYPVLYITENKTSSLVNFRIKDDYIIIDRLFDKAQLVMDKQVVMIKRTVKRGQADA